MEHIYTFYRSKIGLHFQHLLMTYDDLEQAKPIASSNHMYQIAFLISGAGQYVIEGEAYKIAPMNIALLKPGEIHSLEVDTNQPFEVIFLNFSHTLLPEFNDLDLLAPFNNALAFAHIIPKKFVEKYKLFDHIKEIEYLCSTKDKYVDVWFVAAIMQLATILNDCTSELIASQSTSIVQPARTKQLSHHCIQYINGHLTENLTAHDVAAAFNMSVSHIRNAFKKQTRVTIQNYIFNQRMQLAQNLLMQGHSPQAVAKTLHYEYYTTFYYHYKKRFNMKPKAFVNLNRQLYDAERNRMLNLEPPKTNL